MNYKNRTYSKCHIAEMSVYMSTHSISSYQIVYLYRITTCIYSYQIACLYSITNYISGNKIVCSYKITNCISSYQIVCLYKISPLIIYLAIKLSTYSRLLLIFLIFYYTAKLIKL